MEEEDNGIWPPPPAVSPAKEAEPPLKRPRVTDQGIGRASLGLSALSSLGALACVILSSVIGPNGRQPPLYDSLFIGSGGCFFLGFLVGFVGWYSWEGKAGLCLAVLGPPFWVVMGFFVAVAYGP